MINISRLMEVCNVFRLRVATDADKQFRLSRIVAVTEKCLLDVYTTTWVPPASVVTVNDIEVSVTNYNNNNQHKILY